MNALKNTVFQEYIFKELKEKLSVFNKFMKNVVNYIRSILEQGQPPSRKSIVEIINKVNDEISIMNDDLRQISC